jgi:hypothetical protein
MFVLPVLLTLLLLIALLKVSLLFLLLLAALCGSGTLDSELAALEECAILGVLSLFHLG